MRQSFTNASTGGKSSFSFPRMYLKFKVTYESATTLTHGCSILTINSIAYNFSLSPENLLLPMTKLRTYVPDICKSLVRIVRNPGLLNSTIRGSFVGIYVVRTG